MHELSIITSIMNTIKSKMEEANAIELKVIQLEIGELTFLSSDALQFGFESIKNNDKKMEKAILEIKSIPAEIECKNCNYSGSMNTSDSEEYHIQVPVFQCPQCAGPVNIIKGRECIIKNISIEVD